MGTLNLRRFATPDRLRAISPGHLARLFEPFRSYFAERGVALTDDVSSINYEALAAVLADPVQSTPERLIDALFYISELGTDEAMDAIVTAMRQRGLTVEEGQDHSPLDLATQAWLHDPDLLQEKHAEQNLARPRSLESYLPRQYASVPKVELTLESLAAIERDLDAWFLEHKRGDGSRVFAYPQPEGQKVWFLVRHGGTFRREGSLNKGEPDSVAFRPLTYDLVMLDNITGEIRMHAGTKGEKTLYRRAFGLHLFGNADFFADSGKYKLTPLLEDGKNALVCDDVEGLERVVLREIHYFWGGAQGETEIRKAKDLFAAYEGRGRSLPDGTMTKAVFEVQFTGSGKARSVTIKPPNIASYTRDGDSDCIDEWLAKRGFINPGVTVAAVEHTDSVLAGV